MPSVQGFVLRAVVGFIGAVFFRVIGIQHCPSGILGCIGAGPVQSITVEPDRVPWVQIRLYNCMRLQNLGHSIRLSLELCPSGNVVNPT